MTREKEKKCRSGTFWACLQLTIENKKGYTSETPVHTAIAAAAPFRA